MANDSTLTEHGGIDGVVAAEENRGVANNGAVEPEEKYSTMNLLRMMEAASASPEAMEKLGATLSLLKACLGFGDKILAQKQEMAELEQELQRIADVQREHKELSTNQIGGLSHLSRNYSDCRHGCAKIFFLLWKWLL